MSPERREKIIEALISDEISYFVGYLGGDVGMPTKQELRSLIKEDQIAAFDEWLRSIPSE